MDKSLLVRIFGFSATLIHGDVLILDRWRWLKKRLPETRNGESLIDIGCGGGAFSIGAALRGYNSLGLTWDERDQNIATYRAKICGASSARFEVFDVRNLDDRHDLVSQFDVAICFENIEHIINDRKLIIDIANCLKPGGRLLLTTPNILYCPISQEDKGPFSSVEDGGHVRRGYSEAMLEELCVQAKLMPENISYCSGFLSQKITSCQRVLSTIHPLVAWGVIFPLRLLPPIFDWFITKLLHWPSYSICLEAVKPRYSK
ncbi:class I SAM-dependent methyltransferase [Candidatus Methylobacter oryzae]|uniref:Methyltransferase domain-containing protein n=1 Tax=Candidatus Methylobacter oryzae TaxID=2497749 RepID=A0ABY3CF59_9GAMM|nr:methyltransferase domain-containing protein [Candidatus Methylobacter oryzae]TRX01785.1 methyltransferase domain-containing protein [Candidatus Methylobacter oryzae]